MIKFIDKEVKQEVKLSNLEIGDTFMFKGQAYLVINPEFGDGFEVRSNNWDECTCPYHNNLICVTDFVGETHCFFGSTIVTPINIVSTIEEIKVE